MKFSKWSVVSVFVLILSAVLSLGLIAAADAPELGTPEDNACNEGGLMAGKCNSEWHWKGGWHLARFLSGDLTREQVPDEFQILLPPPVEETANVLTICKAYGYEDKGKVCLSSNQTGSMDYDGSGINYYVVFTSISTGADCPTTFNGGGMIGMGLTPSFTNFGFSAVEITTLGLKAYYCEYYTY